MTDDPADAFADAFRRRAPRLDCRAETPEDRPFLIDQFVACSALADTLPPAMLLQQAEYHLAAHAAAHPQAMRSVATLDGVLIGRFMIDWRADEAHGVDLAVMPEHRATGVGLAYLRAWLDVADRRGTRSRLEVTVGNPAARIYARLGFVATGAEAYGVPSITMLRPVPR